MVCSITICCNRKEKPVHFPPELDLWHLLDLKEDGSKKEKKTREHTLQNQLKTSIDRLIYEIGQMQDCKNSLFSAHAARKWKILNFKADGCIERICETMRKNSSASNNFSYRHGWYIDSLRPPPLLRIHDEVVWIRFPLAEKHLTTICVNVRDRVCLFVCLSACYLLPDSLRYGNMNGTMLSQIVSGMFEAPQVHQKSPKIVKKAKTSPAPCSKAQRAVRSDYI